LNTATMFSRRLSPKNQLPKKEESAYGTPISELSQRLDRLEGLIQQTKDAYIESIQPPPPLPPSRASMVVNSLKKLRKKDAPDDGITAPEIIISSKSDAPTTPPRNFRNKNDPEAKFILMESEREEEMVEIIRRIAELVVIGERAAASEAEHREKLKSAEEKDWGSELEEKEGAIRKLKDRSTENDKYIALFDHFFERNGLALITDIVTGAAFILTTDTDDADQSTENLKKVQDDDNCMLLPPIPIATQAVQSVSIMVQNVSRATSLYFILSNNHVNQLIDFPLEHYHVAERKKHNQQSNGMSPRRFGSPELAELTTHFVSFLKSLALRINVETLQFFLTYPSDDDDDAFIVEKEVAPSSTDENPQDTMPDEDMPLDEARPLHKYDSKYNEDGPMDEAAFKRKSAPPKEMDRPVRVKEVQVRFPLYARALEFCSAHQENFIRVTAMNICLNTLRIASVRSPDETEVLMDERIEFAQGDSPDGVLHNAKPLPLRERLAIAQHVCTPSRVELLISPIFTKLAQMWGMLEELFREVDVSKTKDRSGLRGDTDRGKTAANEKVARAKEKARRQKSLTAFNAIADSLQDELLLLEDVLNVGLTSLNEQIIEMMLATFVYPLLLQPLLLYFQRSPVPDEVLFADTLNEHSGGKGFKMSNLTGSEKSLISAPAKSAFFCITGVFQFITNQPLLRLLFTALFHPLAPNATGETMIRAKADVACIGPHGKMTIRVDQFDAEGQIEFPTDRSTYLFGSITGHKYVSGESEDTFDDNDACVFVLSPALAEILQYKGGDLGLIARTRQNPYRKAIFKCFTLSNELSDLRPLSVMAVDSAVSAFGEKFVSDMILGVDLQKFADNMPKDERKSDARWAQALDDRGMGGPMKFESRQALGEATSGKVGFDCMNEVLSSFRSCLMHAAPSGKGKSARLFKSELLLFFKLTELFPVELGTWKLEYDMVAAHALLCVIRGSKSAIQGASKGVDRRCRQAAAFLSDMPANIELCVKVEGEIEDKELQAGIIMEKLFSEPSDKGDDSILDDFLELMPMHRSKKKHGHAVAVSMIGSFKELCNRACLHAPLDADPYKVAIENARSSARAWLKLGK
jgi:hypothetical protein